MNCPCHICAYCDYYGGGNYDWDWVDEWVEEWDDDDEISAFEAWKNDMKLPGYVIPSEPKFDREDLMEVDSLRY